LGDGLAGATVHSAGDLGDSYRHTTVFAQISVARELWTQPTCCDDGGHREGSIRHEGLGERPVHRPRWLLDAQRVDDAVYAAIAGTPTPALDVAMSRLTRAADYSRLSIGAAGVLAVTRGARGRQAAALGLASVAVTATVANLVIKPLGRRRRPDPIEHEVPAARQVRVPRSTSFPSGHSAAAFAFATGVGQVLPAEATALRGLAALVAYSRVHTGVHYPGDVVAGSLMGTALAQLTTDTLAQRWR
jgi:membrane-associated phospholipid phosphatase